MVKCYVQRSVEVCKHTTEIMGVNLKKCVQRKKDQIHELMLREERRKEALNPNSTKMRAQREDNHDSYEIFKRFVYA